MVCTSILVSLSLEIRTIVGFRREAWDTSHSVEAKTSASRSPDFPSSKPGCRYERRMTDWSHMAGNEKIMIGSILTTSLGVVSNSGKGGVTSMATERTAVDGRQKSPKACMLLLMHTPRQSSGPAPCLRTGTTCS